MFDAIFSITLFSILFIAIITFSIKTFLNGRESYERVEKQGSSALVSKSFMEMGYWLFIPVANFFIHRNISPNQISLISLGLGLLAGITVAFGLFGLAATFFLLSTMLDVVDGRVAKETNNMNPTGIILDSSIDRYVDFFFLAGLVFLYRDSTLLMLIGLMAILGSFMVSYSTAKAEAMHVTPPRGNMKRSDRLIYLIFGACFSSLSVAFYDSDNGTGYPMVLVLSIIAILANYSAVQRLKNLAEQLELKEREKEPKDEPAQIIKT